jgi:dethiobiotin synthetase
MLARPVSPHQAAADEGRSIDLAVIAAYVDHARTQVDGLAVELAGGLFSPLGRGLSNADVAVRLGSAVILVAPDRLGVLHDVGAATRAASAVPLLVAGIVLVDPPAPDASTGTNARALALVTDVPVLAVVPRASVSDLADREDLAAVVRRLLSPP